MDIKRAKEEIKNTVRAYLQKDENGHPLIPEIRQRPILLIGPPGIGKTAIMEQAARECGVALVAYTMTHHTRQSALGLPFISEKEYRGVKHSVTEYTMSEIIASVYDKMEETGLQEGILFVDEINCVSETLAPVMLQFLQAKTFGNARVPSGWVIAAAGNPPEYNRSVREFDVVTLDRVKRIDIEADYGIWREYAWKNQVHPAILAYLDARQEHFYQIETTVEGKHFVTARGWEDLSDLLKVYDKLGLPVDEQVAGQYLQEPETAMDFANYLTLYNKYEKIYNVQDILSGVNTEAICDRIRKAPFDERISVVSMMLSGLNQHFLEDYRFDQVVDGLFTFLKKFQKAEHTEAFEQERRKFEQSVTERLRTGLLEYEEEKWLRRTAGILEQWGLLLAEERNTDPKEAFAALQKPFRALTQKREQMLQADAARLDHAFDFLEEAFGTGPELVLFVTELAAGFYSLAFLQEQGNDRFYHYNKALLKDTGRQEMMAEIADAEGQSRRG